MSYTFRIGLSKKYANNTNNNTETMLSGDVKELCNDWAVINDGKYKYENNVWGAHKNLPYKQCLLSKKESKGKKRSIHLFLLDKKKYKKEL